MPRVVAAPDKFRGTASAEEVAGAIGTAARAAGWSVSERPLADGGEGFLEVVPGRLRSTVVKGPTGAPVEARWKLDGRVAYIEMAEASGLKLAGGADGNDPVAASTEGTGQLILAALAAGVRRVVVGVGGSASTDGGLGALNVLGDRTRGVDLVVACDVETTFVDAATTFAEQKGASPAQVRLLERRLERLAQLYRSRNGVEVSDLPGSGAAGGLAGGLAAIGARLTSGFDFVSDLLDLPAEVEGSDLVITGEGFVDHESFSGKVVGGVVSLAEEMGVPCLVVAGEIFDVPTSVDVLSLSALFGKERSWSNPLECVEEAVGRRLTSFHH